ncbi:MAG: DUF1800 family protein, partial [Anaerolineales bacterium]|nr:DUF1800 family protein [Anaerolineales bacterium]
MLNVETDGVAINKHLFRMGQGYFNYPTPDGYSDHSQTWQGNLMPRWQFAFELMRDEMENTKHNLQNLLNVLLTENLEEDIDAISSLLLGSPIERLIRDQLIDSVTSAGANADEALQVITASLIASPAFQWR